MLSDLSVIAISLSVILLCWVVVRLNQKLEEAMLNPKNNKDLDAGDELVDLEVSKNRESQNAPRC